MVSSSVLLSSRPWSWSRVVSMPNLPVLVLLLNKTKTLISTVRSQPQSCDYYTSLRPTVPVSTWCTLLSTSCSHGTVFVYTSDICAGWKGVQPRWPIYEATLCQTGRICVIPPCILEVQHALGLHGHWTLYQLSCRCIEWFDFIDSVHVLH